MATARYVASGVNPSVDNVTAIRALVAYIDQLSTLALQTHANHALLQLAVLDAFERLVSLHTRVAAPFVLVPSDSLFVLLLLSRHAVVLSRACALLVTCRAELGALRSARDSHFASLSRQQQRQQQQLLQSGLERAPLADQAVALYADALWRSRLFPLDDDDNRNQHAPTSSLRSDLNLDASITCN